MDPVEDFVKTFHNLGGITLDEKEKNFRKLLDRNKLLLEDQNAGALIVGKVTPKTHLELLFKVDILLSCRSMNEIMAIFTSGNEILISRILKHRWFFQEAFKDSTAQEIVDDLLPQLSFSTRMKVLKKLCMFLNDAAKLFEIFNGVKNKYGLKIAMPLLLGCSNESVEFVIKNNAVTFTQSQLKRFIQKAPKLLPAYIEEYVKHKNNHDILCNNDVVKHIASTDYDIYSQLREKYKLHVHYGRRMSRKIFEKEKDHILIDPAKYEDMFETGSFIRKLGVNGSFKNYFLKSFPEKIELFSYTEYCDMHCSKLRFYPKSKQFQLLDETFQNVYKIRIDDCPKRVTTHILDMVSDSSRREQIVQKVIEIDDDISFIVFQKTAVSVPFIKKEMNLATNNIAKRKNLVRALVKTCKINDDSNALKEVIKYVALRHRNDLDILDIFFNALKRNYDFHHFKKDMWDVINELIEIYKVKEGNMFSITDMLFTYIEFCYNNSFPLDKLLLDSMKYSDIPYHHIFLHKCTNYKFLQTALVKAIGLLPNVTGKKVLSETYCDFAARILSWNQEHPDYVISIIAYPILIESFKKQCKGARYYNLKPLICSKDRSREIVELTDLYWDKHLSSDTDIVLYYLKWYPETFLNHIKYSVDGLIKACDRQNAILYKMKKYDYITLPQNIIKYIQGQLEIAKETSDLEKDESNMPISENTFRILASLMNSNDYVNYIAKYKPKSLSVDMTKDEDKEMYQIQCYIVTNLKYLNFLSALPQIFTYCGGDFLKYALAPLYKIFHRTPEIRLQPFFHQLIKNAVSVRKHAVFLALQILDLCSIKNILKSVSDVEKNDSVKKRFMETSLKLFQQNPSDDFWDIFKLSLTFIDENDTESFQTLVDVKYIPLTYKLLYFNEVWSLLNTYNLLEVRKYRLRNQLACKMESSVKHLSSKFCMEIIGALFLKFSDATSYEVLSINSFIFEYLLNHEEPLRFVEVYRIIEIAKNSACNSTLRTTVHREVCRFIDEFCTYFIYSTDINKWDKPMTKDFLKSLSTIYPDAEFFSEYIMVSMVLILLNLSKLDAKIYASDVSVFIQSIHDAYGPYVCDFLEANITRSLKYFNQSGEFEREFALTVEFIKYLLEVNSTELAYKIALELLLPCDKGTPGYQELINIFKSCDYPYIQISLRQKLLFSLYAE